MKAIRFLPAKHDAPSCEAYADEREVRRFERAMRVHRAYAEAFRVVPLDERVDGTCRVTSASSRAYLALSEDSRQHQLEPGQQ
jgi:hypothetical protein